MMRNIFFANHFTVLTYFLANSGCSAIEKNFFSEKIIPIWEGNQKRTKFVSASEKFGRRLHCFSKKTTLGVANSDSRREKRDATRSRDRPPTKCKS